MAMGNIFGENDESMDFMSEVPTNRCGEGGCSACDAAFRASCEPLPVTRVNASFVLQREVWEEDTVPEAVPLGAWEGDTERIPHMEPDIDPYSAAGDDWFESFEVGGEGG